MIYRITFWDGASITVTKRQYEIIDAAINAGATHINVSDVDYSVKDIRRRGPEAQKGYRDISELNLPPLNIPEELQAAYDSRTITVDDKKLIGGSHVDIT